MQAGPSVQERLCCRLSLSADVGHAEWRVGEGATVQLWVAVGRHRGRAASVGTTRRNDPTPPFYAVLSRWHYKCNHHSFSHATFQRTRSLSLCRAVPYR